MFIRHIKVNLQKHLNEQNDTLAKQMFVIHSCQDILYFKFLDRTTEYNVIFSFCV